MRRLCKEIYICSKNNEFIFFNTIKKAIRKTSMNLFRISYRKIRRNNEQQLGIVRVLIFTDPFMSLQGSAVVFRLIFFSSTKIQFINFTPTRRLFGNVTWVCRFGDIYSRKVSNFPWAYHLLLYACTVRSKNNRIILYY